MATVQGFPAPRSTLLALLALTATGAGGAAVGAAALGGGLPWAVAAFALAALLGGAAAFAGLAHRRAARRSRKSDLLGELASEINRAILLNEDEGKIFSTILDYAFRILENVNLGSVLAFDGSGQLVIVGSRGFSEEFVHNFRLRLEDSFQYRQSGGNIAEAMIIRPEIIRRFSDRLDSSREEYKSIISAPLFVGGKLYGFLNVDSVRANSFGAEDLELLKRFASQIEVCLLARQRYMASLAESRVDGLTGFLSRSSFEQIADHTVERAKRYGERFVLGMFDVDGLKAVNDARGHQAGDTLLCAAASAIRETARKSDAIGRYGGDEFIAIYCAADARAMAERAELCLSALAESPPSFGGKPIPVSFCYGMAEYPADADSIPGLLAIADAKLYAMKAARAARARRPRGAAETG